MNKEIVAQAIEECGGIQKVAENFGISYESVRKWIVSGKIPAKRVSTIVSLCEGKCSADQLRPDIFSGLVSS